MADRIVQLVDKDDNNLFPVAGSMKQGSVTTNLLADEAVTPDKIDISALVEALPFGSVEPMNFKVSRVGGASSTHEGRRIHLFDDVYIYTGIAESGSAGSSSTGVKEYTLSFDTRFSLIYGGTINAGAVGSTSSFMRYGRFVNTGADFYVDHAASNEKVQVQFIAIGRITS